jgi:hypothetical protein
MRMLKWFSDSRTAHRVYASSLVFIVSVVVTIADIMNVWGAAQQTGPGFTDVLLALSKREDGILVGDNEPSSVNDAMDHTILVHGERLGALHVENEIRQDMINDDGGQRMWAVRLARLLPEADQTLAVGAPRINHSDLEPS